MRAVREHATGEDALAASSNGAIPPALLRVLACPSCGSDLESGCEMLECAACGSSFPVANGVPIFEDSVAYLHAEALQRSRALEISLILPTLNEEDNLVELAPLLEQTLSELTPSYEIIVVDGGSKDRTVERARQLGFKVMIQELPGYGNALKQAFRSAEGKHIITMDADLSHNPTFIREMYEKRDSAELIIASRYVPGGAADTSAVRHYMSRVLNWTFKKLLSLPYEDMSSGFRMYQAKVFDNLQVDASQYDFLEELLIRVHMLGWRIIEIPFAYKPRKHGTSKARPLKLAMSYLKTLLRLWRLRNSVFSADYDNRAFDSIIPLQRYWQRTRYRIIRGFLDRDAQRGLVLDIGCGSSRIIQSLPEAIGLDIELKKLRFIQGGMGSTPLVEGSIMRLPFKDSSFANIVCSEVIEHVDKDPVIFSEINRVLQPNGTLIIGTPDYATLSWRVIEWFYGKILPDAYVDEHISHYTAAELVSTLRASHFRLESCKRVLHCEMIFLARRQKDGVGI